MNKELIVLAVVCIIAGSLLTIPTALERAEEQNMINSLESVEGQLLSYDWVSVRNNPHYRIRVFGHTENFIITSTLHTYYRGRFAEDVFFESISVGENISLLVWPKLSQIGNNKRVYSISSEMNSILSLDEALEASRAGSNRSYRWGIILFSVSALAITSLVISMIRKKTSSRVKK